MQITNGYEVKFFGYFDTAVQAVVSFLPHTLFDSEAMAVQHLCTPYMLSDSLLVVATPQDTSVSDGELPYFRVAVVRDLDQVREELRLFFERRHEAVCHDNDCGGSADLAEVLDEVMADISQRAVFVKRRVSTVVSDN